MVKQFIIFVCAMFLCGGVVRASVGEQGVAEAVVLLRFVDLAEEYRVSAGIFSMDSNGQPWLSFGHVVVALKIEEKKEPPSPLLVAPGTVIDQFAWTSDGVPLVVSGRRLGTVGLQGFVPMIDLPSDHMRLVAAPGDFCYLFGGDNARNLLLVQKDGGIRHLFEAEGPITAVAGYGEHTFVAVGKAVYRLTQGELVELLGELRSDVLSIAPNSATSVFYATGTTVGYLSPGRASTLAEKDGVQLALHDEKLYLFIPGEGLIVYSPVSKHAGKMQAVTGG